MISLNLPTRTSCLMLALSLATLPALASDNPGAHQHGHADLQIAVDNNRIDLLLLSPAYNLIGFEHKPQTEEQRQRVQAVEHWAAKTPLINTQASDCTMTSAAMHVSWGDNDDHDHGHHHHSHDHGGDHAQKSTHADVEITQSLNCPDLSGTTRLEASLMTRFPELEHLNVQWVGPQGQGAIRLSQGDRHFRMSR